jgi:hypothetical protein
VALWNGEKDLHDLGSNYVLNAETERDLLGFAGEHE